jgi:hypothetical protein
MRYRLRLTKPDLVILVGGWGVSWIAANIALKTRHPRALYWIYGIYFGAILLWSFSRIVRLLLRSEVSRN